MYTQKSDYWHRFNNATHSVERYTIDDSDIAGSILPQVDYVGGLKIKDLLYIRQIAAQLGGGFTGSTDTQRPTAKQMGRKLLDNIITGNYRNNTRHHTFGTEWETCPYAATILDQSTVIPVNQVKADEVVGYANDYWIETYGLDAHIAQFNLPAYADIKGGFDTTPIKRIYDTFLNKGYKYILGNWVGLASMNFETYPMHFSTDYFYGSGVRQETEGSGTDKHLVQVPSSWKNINRRQYDSSYLGFRDYIDGGYRRASYLYATNDYSISQSGQTTKYKVYLEDITNEATARYFVPPWVTRAYGVLYYEISWRSSPSTAGGDTQYGYYYVIVEGTVSDGVASFNLLAPLASIKAKATGWSDSCIGSEYTQRYTPFIRIGNPDFKRMIVEGVMPFDLPTDA